MLVVPFLLQTGKKIAKNVTFLINEIRREQKSWDKKHLSTCIPA